VIAIVDNYDSFTYNLVHYLEDLSDEKPMVCMNDEINWNMLDQCSHIVLSPGPGLPQSSGELMKVIDTYHSTKKILGVCLGMQAIATYFEGSLVNLDQVQHGVQTTIQVEMHSQLYKGLSGDLLVGRYHSWAVDKKTLPGCLRITSEDEKGTPMSLEHRSLPIYAVQYHPESIMTDDGKKILQNWLEM
jgi:anthranilate synthase component II